MLFYKRIVFQLVVPMGTWRGSTAASREAAQSGAKEGQNSSVQPSV